MHDDSFTHPLDGFDIFLIEFLQDLKLSTSLREYQLTSAIKRETLRRISTLHVSGQPPVAENLCFNSAFKVPRRCFIATIYPSMETPEATKPSV